MSADSNDSQLNLENLIQLLLEVREYHPSSKMINMSENEIKTLCAKATEIFLSQPMLLELKAPFKIGGDYVDRGRQSLETICLLLAYKIKYPDNFFLLRGNHECAAINRIYGFYDECKRRYSIKLWKSFNECFNCLPVAAVIDRKIFCCHGGLSPELQSLEQIKRIQRPTDVPDSGLVCDLLWTKPDNDVKGWNENNASISPRFGVDVVTQFLYRHKMDLICRSHQVVKDGYEFFGDRQLVTIFSVPNYCGGFDNAGALMSVDENLTCSFTIFPS
ncbi:unnamed protein product, partial [Rotaria sordida]